MHRRRILTCATVATACLAACGDESKGSDGSGTADVPFGETAIVMIVNPEPNEGNSVPVPGSFGDVQAGVEIVADPGGETITDPLGLGVIGSLEPGPVALNFDAHDDATASMDVVEHGDVYDVAVAYDGASVTIFDNFPVRYPVGGEVVTLGPDSGSAELTAALETNDNIVVIEEGEYAGDLEVTGENILFFGEGFTHQRVVIDGNVRVTGSDVRIRGLEITGNVDVPADDFAMAFSVVRGSTNISGDRVAFVLNQFCETPTVPSSSAALLGNEGMMPLPAPPEETCNPEAESDGNTGGYPGP